MNKQFGIVLAVLIVLIIGLIALGQRSQAPQSVTTLPENQTGNISNVASSANTQTVSSSDSGISIDVNASAGASATKEFTVSGNNFAFSPARITVKKGDKVKITFKNTGGMHDWRVDEFQATSNVIKSGEQEVIEFVADKTGQFEYYCSVGQHRQMGMKGVLVVE